MSLGRTSVEVKLLWCHWRHAAFQTSAALREERSRTQREQIHLKRTWCIVYGTPFGIWQEHIYNQRTECVEMWAEKARKSRLLNRHLKRTKHSALHKCYEAWYTHAMDEMWKAVSISTIVLRMIESSLFLALQHWVYCVEAVKRERGDFQLTQRCMLAENQVAGQICDLKESKRRLRLADTSVEAMIEACSECTVALDASKSSSIQQLSRMFSQQALLLDMTNNVMMKHAREKQDLNTCYEAELCEKNSGH